MSSKPAAIPLFADAYLADTMHLTTEEHGAYLLLLMAAWRQDDCSLPDDDRKLARIVGLTARKWSAIRGTILEFWTVEDGKIYQARLRKERGYVRQKSEANRQNVRKRWEAQSTENIDGATYERTYERNTPPPPPIEEPNGSSPHSPHAEPNDGSPVAYRGRGWPVIPDWMPIGAWNAFIDMRKRKRAMPTARAAEMLISKLDEMRKSGCDPGAALDQSTLKSWTDIYPPKDRSDDRSSHAQPLDRRDGYARELDRRLGLGEVGATARPVG